MTKILIVEDQKWPLRALNDAVNAVAPRHFIDYLGHDTAKSYNDAQKLISARDYTLVLLDNRLPYENQGNLEDRDMHAFSSTLENIGYTLIPKIKERNSKTIVIGTSSMSKDELKGFPTPDFTMSKMYGEAEENLEEILKKVINSTH